MGIEKLIEQLNDFNANHISVLCGSGQCACGYLCDKDDCIVVRAATALSTLQAENEKLRGYINDLETQHRTEMCENGYDCVELGKLRAELEQVKEERDEAVQCIRGIAKSGRVWMCPYCVHAKDTTGGIAECELDVGACMMPYSKFEWHGQKKN